MRLPLPFVTLAMAMMSTTILAQDTDHLLPSHNASLIPDSNPIWAIRGFSDSSCTRQNNLDQSGVLPHDCAAWQTSPYFIFTASTDNNHGVAGVTYQLKLYIFQV
jgi:hypothetical protein